MDKVHKKLLQRNNHYLFLNLNIKDNKNFWDIMSPVLLPNNIKDIELISSNKDQVNKFLDILPRRGSKAFDIFLNALQKSDQLFLKNALTLSLGININNANVISEDNTDSFAGKKSSSFMHKLLIIINVENYNDKEYNREGSQKDVECIKKFFITELNWKLIFEPKDPSALEILVALTEFRDAHVNDKEKTLVGVFIMCHGKSMHIIGSDKEVLAMKTVLDILNFKNENVINMIIFSCCRGDADLPKICPESSNCIKECNTLEINESEGDEIDSGGSSISINYSITENILQNRMNQTVRLQDLVDDEYNTVTMYSTQNYYRSLRVPDGDNAGTVFIQSLLTVFQKYYKNKSLREMVLQIKRTMNELYPEYDQYPEIKEFYTCELFLY